MSEQPTELTATALAEAIRERRTSCVEVMRAYLDRIERLNPVYNAIVSLADPDDLLRQAQAADEELARGEYRGWMHGMPHAVKDLADIEGFPTSRGSPLFAGAMAPADSLFVSRIRQQGAIFIGKTNTPEFGLGSQTYNPVFGATGNAFDPTWATGGSSGGAAVGVATCMLPVADGSDFGGSLRNPGAYNGVVGYRPSQGRVPSYPDDDGFYQQLATDGPLARNVEDAIRLLTTMARPDPRSPLSRRDPLPEPEAFQPTALEDIRIGWLGDYDGRLPTEPGLLTLCESALGRLEAKVEPTSMDFDLARLWEAWLAIRGWSNLKHKPLYDDPSSRERLKPEAIWEIESGMAVTGEQLSIAGRTRTEWFHTMRELFARYDILALPAAQVFPFDIETPWPRSIAGTAMDTYHRWMEIMTGPTLAGLPTVSLPAGLDERGRPMGIQFMAPPGDDQTALEFGLAYEQAVPPPVPPIGDSAA